MNLSKLCIPKSKKGFFGSLQTIVLSLVIVAIVLVVGLLVLRGLQNQLTNATNNTAEFNATKSAISALATVPNWFGVLITIGVAIVILGAVFLLAGRGGRSR